MSAAFKGWAAALALSFAVACAYGLTLKAPVFYDDAIFVRDHPINQLPFPVVLREIASRRYFPFTQERTYQPLITLFHYSTHETPLTYRLAGIALHALNSWLLFLLAGRLLKPKPAPALLCAMLFALFPTHTEVVNISAFKGHLLSSTFILLTLLSWLKAEDGSIASFWLCHLFCLTALLCKETGILAPILVLAHALSVRAPKYREILRRWSGLALISAAYLACRFGLLEQPPPPLSSYPHWRWVGLNSFGWYLRTLIFPYPLCLEHSFEPLSAARGILAACVRWILPELFLALLWIRRKDRHASFCLLWIFLACLPFLHLISFANYSPVADRYLYLPCAGFCLLLGGFLRGPRLKYLGYVLILWWGAQTLARNTLYSDQSAFFQQTAACAPTNPRAQALLGAYYLYNTKDTEATLGAFNRAFALDPELGTHFLDPGLIHVQKSDYVYGIVHMNTKDFKTAQADFTRALRRAPDVSARAADLLHIAEACLAQGHEEEALLHYRLARAALPAWFIPYLRGGSLLIKKDPRRAPRALEMAKSLIDKRSPNAHYKALSRQLLGEAYWKLGEKKAAIEEWKDALRVKPDNLDLLERIARAQAGTGDEIGAAETYRLLVAAADALLRRCAELKPPDASQSREIEELARGARSRQTAALAALKSISSRQASKRKTAF